MRVLFVYLYGEIPYFPIGVGSVSSLLKKHGHETKLSYINKKRNPATLLGDIESWNPEVVAFSSVSSYHGLVERASGEIKRKFPHTFVVYGGIHATLVPECIERSNGIDALCRGEGEYPMLELVERLERGLDYFSVHNMCFRKGDSIIRNRMRPLIQNVDELPAPDHRLFEEAQLPGHETQRGDFMFTRGCPFSCSYCSHHAMRELSGRGTYVRFRSVKNAIEELRLTTSEFPIHKVVIHDDIICLRKDWFSDFLREYREKVTLPFLCNIRPGTCTKEMFVLLKESGCEGLLIGVESGNDYMREAVLKRSLSHEAIVDTFRMAHEAGISTFSFNMVGLPYETPERFLDTVRLNASLGPMNSPWLYIYHPYPKTELGELCMKKGWITAHSVDFTERQDTVLALPTFPRRLLLTYYNYFDILVDLAATSNGGSFLTLERASRLLSLYPTFFPLLRLYDLFLRMRHKGVTWIMKKLLTKARLVYSNLIPQAD